MKHIKKEQIKGITLLTAEKARATPRWIIACGEPYWLRSPGYDATDAAIVYSDGLVDLGGDFVDYFDVAVRPALIIPNLKSSHLILGETVSCANRMWQYIGDDMILACSPIGHQRFDGKSNIYIGSELNSYLERWLKDAINS